MRLSRNIVFKIFFTIISVIFKNGPTIAFWASYLIIFRGWFLGLPIFVKLALVIVSLVFIIVTLRDAYLTIKDKLLEIPTEDSLLKTKATDNNIIAKFKKNILSQKEIISIYKYADVYSKKWSRDGKVLNITLYFQTSNNRIEKTAQIFIESLLKGEKLTFYLPRKSKNIEEVNLSKYLGGFVSTEIYKIRNWRDATLLVIDRCEGEVQKSDSARLQLCPGYNMLGLTFYFEKNDRKWKRAFELVENKIRDINNDTVIHSY